MDTESVKLFWLVQQNGNITKAANDLFITQSAASKKLKQLEKELGVSLFRRGKGQLQAELTPAGKAFSQIADRMLLLYDQAEELKRHADYETLTLACINSAQDYALPPFLMQFQEKYPNIHFTLEDHHTYEIVTLLAERRIDIGIIQGEASAQNFRSVHLYDENYRVVSLSDFGLPAGKAIRPEDLRAENEIYEDFGAAFRQWHDSLWRISSAKIRVNTTPTAKQYLRSPETWTVVPDSIAYVMEQEGFNTRRLTVETPPHPVYAVCRKTARSEAIRHFIDGAQQYYQQKTPW